MDVQFDHNILLISCNTQCTWCRGWQSARITPSCDLLFSKEKLFENDSSFTSFGSGA